MRDERTTDAAPGKRTRAAANLRARIPAFRRQGNGRGLGLPEVAALAVAFLFLFAALGAYFFLLVPERSRLAASEREREQLQTKLRASTEGVERNESTQASVEKIVQSLNDFEVTTLGTRDPQTTTAVIQELHDRTQRNGLSRPQFSFSHLDEFAPGQTSTQRSSSAAGANKRQNVFPTIDISLTVEGPYANLRRFIRDIEQSRRFIVINGIQLEGVSDTGNAARSALVNLRLDMSAYFRRGGAHVGGATPASDTTSQ